MKKRNPYAPLRYATGVAAAMAACPRWRMVTVVLGATLPGRAWPKQAFTVGWSCPGDDIAGDGPSAWFERDHTGAGVQHNGAPPAQPGIVCDEDWNPVTIHTHGGQALPRLDTTFEID